MRWILTILGVVLGAFGILWILQGTNVLKGGLMGGHIQYAFLGLAALIVGIALIAYGNRRQKVLG